MTNSYSLVGHFYWILGGWKVNQWDKDNFVDQQKTSVFSMKRGLWFDGPDLPDIIAAAYAMKNTFFCVTGLNRTCGIFIGVGTSRKGVAVYNFETNSWSQMADTPRKILWCSCSSSHENNNKQYFFLSNTQSGSDVAKLYSVP